MDIPQKLEIGSKKVPGVTQELPVPTNMPVVTQEALVVPQEMSVKSKKVSDIPLKLEIGSKKVPGVTQELPVPTNMSVVTQDVLVVPQEEVKLKKRA